MRLFTVLAFVLTLAVPPAPLQAQGGELSPEETAAYQMSREFSFMCSPDRHRSLTGRTSSVARRSDETMEGTAALLRSAEGTFLVVEGYDAQLFGHCLVLGWFGRDLEAGTYPVSRLSMGTLEEELAAERHSFFAMPAVRTDEENSVLVAGSGEIEIQEMEGGRFEGTFSLTGVHVDRGRRGGSVTWEGSFSAVPVER